MVSFNGYNTKVITAITEMTKEEVESPITFGNDSRVSAAGDGQDFLGICVAVRDMYCSVQTDGYVELTYQGTAPKYGFVNLVSTDGKAVKVAEASKATGVLRRVIKVDEDNKTVGFLL